jgi:hypothetical protein
MKTHFFNQKKLSLPLLVFIWIGALFVVLWGAVHTPLVNAQTDPQPFCTIGTERDYSDRYCSWNSSIAEWECKTSLVGCTGTHYGCTPPTGTCEVDVRFYCLVQNNGRDCYTESETRTSSCTNDCDDAPDPVDPPPPPPPPDDTEYQTIRVQKDGTGTGTVTSSPSGINCGSTCSQTSESRSRWDLTASPSSGSTFTRWSIGQYTYGGPPCITYGGKNNSCTQWTQIPTCGTVSQCRVDVPADSTSTVTATFTSTAPPPPSSPTLSCNAVSPTQINLSWTAVPPSSLGTATEYTVSRCTGICNPSTAVHTTTSRSWNNTGRTASTTYRYRVEARPGSSLAVQSNVVACTTPPPPPPPVLNVRLDGPSTGTIGQVLNFTAVRLPTSTTTGGISYSNPTCGADGTLVWPVSTNNRFSCQYPSVGNRLVSIRVAQGTATETASRSVNVREPSIDAVTVSVDPKWIRRGGSTTVRWTTDPADPGSSTQCRVNSSGSWLSYPGTNSRSYSNILQATTYEVTCRNAAPSSASGSATVYILPSYSEF